MKIFYRIYNMYKNHRGLSVILFVIVLLLIILFMIDHFNKQGKDKFLNIDFKINPDYNDTAKFLAGKEISEKSPLYKYSITKQYLNYKNDMDPSWDKLQELNEKKIKEWREKFLPEEYTGTVLYPFSGPDLLNARLFFPDGYDYIMFGMESPGEIPRPLAVQPAKLYSGLFGLRTALNSELNVNYFKTRQMEVNVDNGTLNSVTSVIMFFLARTGSQVLDVKKIWIDDKSEIANSVPQKGEIRFIPGIEIIFRKAPDEPVRRVRYFMINVQDVSLKTYTNFIPFLERQGRFTTFIKSASYLMHKDIKYAMIRDIILSQSDYILQDDSGVPLRCFDPSEWKLAFHGIYTKPVPLFVRWFQPALDEAMKKYSTGQLPFGYGYKYRKTEANLMFAERIKK